MLSRNAANNGYAWQAPVAGADLSVQYNNDGVAGGFGSWDDIGNTLSITGNEILTSASASALSVGPNGDTNPVLRVVANVASAATGVAVIGRAAGGKAAIRVITSGTNEDLALEPAGTGKIVLQNAAENADATLSWPNFGWTLTPLNNAIAFNVQLATTSFLNGNYVSLDYANGDCSIYRVAPKVMALGPGNNSAVTSWLQTAGECALASAFTDATGTLTATNLSRTLIAGRSYLIEGYLIVSNSTAADGSQFNFNGGNCTISTFDVAFTTEGSVVAGTLASTTLAGVLNYTTNTGTDRVFVKGYIKVANGGTVTLNAATNTHVSGTMTLAAGSWLKFTDVNNL